MKTLASIKRYPDQLHITSSDGEVNKIADLGHHAGEYTRDEWLQDDVVSQFDTDSQNRILDELERSTNIDFFAKNETYVIESADGELIDEDLSLGEAVHALLTHDGADYEIRLCEELDNDGTYYRAYFKNFSGDKWHASNYSACTARVEDAEQEIFHDIFKDHGNWSNSPRISLTTDYQEMLLEIAGNNDEQ